MKRQHKKSANASQLRIGFADALHTAPGSRELLPWLERRCLAIRASNATSNPPAHLIVTWTLDGREWTSKLRVAAGTMESRRVAHELMDHGERLGPPDAPIAIEVRWPSGKLWRRFELHNGAYELLEGGAE